MPLVNQQQRSQYVVPKDDVDRAFTALAQTLNNTSEAMRYARGVAYANTFWNNAPEPNVKYQAPDQATIDQAFLKGKTLIAKPRVFHDGTRWLVSLDNVTWLEAVCCTPERAKVKYARETDLEMVEGYLDACKSRMGDEYFNVDEVIAAQQRIAANRY